MKKLLLSTAIGISSLVGGVIGHNIGYKSGQANQSANEVTAVRVESAKHPISLDDSLEIYVETKEGTVYNVNKSFPRDQNAKWSYNANPGVGFVGRDAYKNESSVGAYTSSK